MNKTEVNNGISGSVCDTQLIANSIMGVLKATGLSFGFLDCFPVLRCSDTIQFFVNQSK